MTRFCWSTLVFDNRSITQRSSVGSACRPPIGGLSATFSRRCTSSATTGGIATARATR